MVSLHRSSRVLSRMEQTVGPYRLARLLGRGGLGEVHLADDQRLGRQVAIKRLRPERLGDQRAAIRLRREAEAVASLNHHAIVQIFDILQDREGLWVVFEYIEGQSLARCLRGGPLSVAKTLEVGSCIADGLARVHATGIIHRDLKTDNVMLPTTGGAKILDFGLAKDLRTPHSALTAKGALLGTARAMSPEQTRGFELDARSDLFSFGVLLYECLGGRSPFVGESLVETMNRICTHQQESLAQLHPTIPGELSDLVDQLLEKAPPHRPTSDAVRDSLNRLRKRTGLSGAGSKAKKAPPPEPILQAGSAGPPQTGSEARPGRHASKRKISFRVHWAQGAAMPLRVAARPFFALLTISFLALSPYPLDFSRHALGAPDSLSDGPVNWTESAKKIALRRGVALLTQTSEAGNIDRALHLFQDLVERAPGSAEAYAWLSRARWWKYRESGHDRWQEQALEAAGRATDLDPKLAAAQVSFGLAQIGLDNDASREAFELALRLDPSAADAHKGFGSLLASLGQLHAANSLLTRGFEIRPGDPDWVNPLREEDPKQYQEE